MSRLKYKELVYYTHAIWTGTAHCGPLYLRLSKKKKSNSFATPTHHSTTPPLPSQILAVLQDAAHVHVADLSPAVDGPLALLLALDLDLDGAGIDAGRLESHGLELADNLERRRDLDAVPERLELIVHVAAQRLVVAPHHARHPLLLGPHHQDVARSLQPVDGVDGPAPALLELLDVEPLGSALLLQEG